ncbi:CRISPR-associated helicase Cas3' [Segnochrobactraceae bacterium EtOH-i3]
MTDALLSFWGKARPGEEDGPGFHPLLWHSLDVAAVCAALLALDDRPARRLARVTGGSVDAARLLLVRLAALHDLGKVALGFQAKVPALLPAVFGPLPARLPRGDHPAIGLALLLGPLRPLLTAMAPAFERADWAALLPAVSGHHGRPVEAADMSEREIGAAGIAAARALMEAVHTVFPGSGFGGVFDDPLPGRPDPRALLSWEIAGLMTLADWIGSSRAAFPYVGPDQDPAAYLATVARPRAARAVAQAGLGPKPVRPAGGLAALTGARWQPSPLQAEAERLPLPADGPALLIVEDMTGAGKTEAALILAHRLMHAGAAHGLYCALPTMATANALWARLGACYRRLYEPDARPSLVLAHGGRALHPGFRASVLDLGTDEAPLGPDDDELTASAACARWIADDSRRSLFADVGAGTVDQAILAVLPAKFAPLRLAGLAGKVLVLDEIHSYDPYVTTELARLVEFHAALGGPVIALSATLSAATRAALVQAFRRGRGLAAGAGCVTGDLTAYPALTLVGPDGAASARKIDPRPDLVRQVALTRLPDATAARAAVMDAARAGACVVWIRNTVDDVLEAQAALAAEGHAATAFHARFAPIDRQRIETDVLARFGRDSGPEARRGQILVASQVVEQSLDLDFDLLVTDLAPIDLVIQRAGRLWRHARGPRPPLAPGAPPPVGPRMLIVSPEPVADAPADWYWAAFGRAGKVYPDHAALWRTAQVLFAAGHLDAPKAVRGLVESVFGPGGLDAVPEALMRARDTADGERKAEAGSARGTLLVLGDGYRAGPIWTSDTRPPTRLSEARTLLRLARIDGPAERPQLAPFAVIETDPGEPADWALRRAWSRSELAVRAARITGRPPLPDALEAAARRLEADWRRVGDFAVVLPLAPDGPGWVTRATSPRGEVVSLRYDRTQGLVFSGG